jgi:16S rRNA G527 N7-methylase RsmG
MLQRGTASPRLAAAGPGPLLSVGHASPSKYNNHHPISNGSGGLLGSLLGNGGGGHGAAVRAQQGPHRAVVLLVALSLLLNVITIALLLARCGGGESGGTKSNDGATHEPAVLAAATTNADTSRAAELSALQARELATLQETLSSLRAERAEAIAGEKAALERATAALDERAELAQQVAELKAAVASAGANSASDCPCRQHSRLAADDLALQGDRFSLSSHEFEWKCDETLYKHPGGNGSQIYCPETATNEQYFQLTFFDRPGAGSKVAVRQGRPVSPSCVQLPPRGYRWPDKTAVVPVPIGSDGVHWPNLRVESLRDLLVFNKGTPKNLYHFNASYYDREQESIVSHAARFIPFEQKVRVMLDIGSGGGSLGLILKKRYDVQVVSTVFADWPYCEYITERGNLCMSVPQFSRQRSSGWRSLHRI